MAEMGFVGASTGWLRSSAGVGRRCSRRGVVRMEASPADKAVVAEVNAVKEKIPKDVVQEPPAKKEAEAHKPAAKKHLQPKDVVHVASDSDPTLMDPVRERTRLMKEQPTSIVVIGASGDLAKKKTFPAIFSLFYHDLLPDDFMVYGYARSKMTDEQFREMIMGTLTCRVVDGEYCNQKMEEFLPRCHYVSGMYDKPEDMASLSAQIDKFEKGKTVSNRMFYLAVPPSIFESVAGNIDETARGQLGWTRVIVEKPFGRDLESYRKLRTSMSQLLDEDEIYRIDHYLGKELVQNVMALRFANSFFEPLWNRNYIESVQFIFKENFGVSGRTGFFEDVGIIRDIMQNHLLQALAMVAMEVPVSLHAEDIRNEKVKLLRAIKPLTTDDFVIGQYTGKDGNPSYRDLDGVNPRSRTPTFAACCLHINNSRWDGVPFLMRAGKGLDEKKTEIRIVFKQTPGAIFNLPQNIRNNELVIRVQSDEAIYLNIANKVPGLTSRMEGAKLNLFYKEAWEEAKDIPDAYERLILDVLYGDKSLFIRDDELEVAWEIFSPAIRDLEDVEKREPEMYKWGTRGGAEADYLAAKFGTKWSDK